jgi:hypothetical protein
MYRQGLSDSFLLAFAGESRSDPVYMLIDCNAHLAQAGGRDTMVRVVDDIIECTGGRLDIVVATDEHSDHLSAFKHRADRLLQGDLKIGQLWLAWTEDGSDELAQQLRRERVAAQEAVEAALERLKEEAVETREPRAPGLSASLDAALQFFAIDEAEDPLSVAALARKLGVSDRKATGNPLALALLKDQAEEVRYFTHGKNTGPDPGSPAGALVRVGAAARHRAVEKVRSLRRRSAGNVSDIRRRPDLLCPRAAT